MPEAMSDATLLDVVDGLRVMYKSLSSKDDPTQIQDAWDVVAKEMRARGLMYEPLIPLSAPVQKDDPTSSDVHVDAVMGAGGKKKAKSPLPGEVKPGDKDATDNTTATSKAKAKVTAPPATPSTNTPASSTPDPNADGDEDDPKPKPNMDPKGKPTSQKPPVPPAGKKRNPFAKRLTLALAKAMGAEFDAEAFAASLETPITSADLPDEDFDYQVMEKSSTPSLRYTLGPVYLPNHLDAHQEWTSPEELQKAAWGYVEETGGERTVYLQHSPLPAGKWVEMVTWPHEVETTMLKSVDGVLKSAPITLPAGTTYMGVIWEPWAHELVQKGEITGFSMGGWAQRLEAALAA